MVLRNEKLKKLINSPNNAIFMASRLQVPSSKLFRFSLFLVFNFSLASDDIFWLLLVFSFLLMRKISFYRHQKKKFYD